MSQQSGCLIPGSSSASISAVRRKNPEAVAWAILLGAFAVFCAIAVTIPLLALRFRERATTPNRIELINIVGVTQVREGEGAAWLAVSGKQELRPGVTCLVDANTRSMLTIYEGSSDYVLATIHVFGGTTFRVSQATRPRFQASRQPIRIYIVLEAGRLRINPGPATGRPVDLRVWLPGGEVRIEEGSAAVEVSADAAEIGVRSGRSLLISARTGEQLSITTGERAVLSPDGAISGPLPGGRNLLANGNFGAGLTLGWEIFNDQGGDGGHIDGQVRLVEEGGQRRVRFERGGGQKDHCATGIRQVLRRDVTDYVALRVRADLRLLYQSLSGGGFQGSEFPLMIKLNYRDARGNPQHWYHGFYYTNPAGFPAPYADQIEQNVWFAYESPDLMALLGDNRPAFLESIEVYASGHDYQAELSEIQVVAE